MLLESVLSYLPPWQHLLCNSLTATSWLCSPQAAPKKHIIIDTDLFSDVDDAAALLLAATSPNTDILAVNINTQSSYSALAASAILAHYSYPEVPIGLRRPITSDSYFDAWFYKSGEYASKVAFHWSGGTLRWGKQALAERAWHPVELYRKVLAGADNGGVTIVSIGFLENLSGLLNSTADQYSAMSGPDLIRSKVNELVVMGGTYPSGHEFNFFGDNPSATAHVIDAWPSSPTSPMTFSGFELGAQIMSGAQLTTDGPDNDPVKAAYKWYTGYNVSRESWDPVTMLYALYGLGETLEFAGEAGRNRVWPNGSNEWVEDGRESGQRWLRLREGVDGKSVGKRLDELYLKGARSVSN